MVDDTHAYTPMDYEGSNPFSAPGVGGIVSLVKVGFGLLLKISPLALKWPPSLESGDIYHTLF